MEDQTQTDKNPVPRESFKNRFTKFHDKHYKKLLIIPLLLVLSSLVYMGVFYSQNGDIIHKDISLTGGTSVTINSQIDSSQLKAEISGKLEDVNVREISDLITKEEIAVIVETRSDEATTRAVLEDFLGYKLTKDNSSFEFTGSSLSGNFYSQLLVALLIAFALMSVVVFFQFKSFVPSIAVIFSAFADLLMTLVVVNLLGLKISGAGIVALLMLIGYSVDTDILLTNKVLKRHDKPMNRRIFDSFKTGITMTATSFAAVLLSLVIIGSFSTILYQIFLIMTIGLCFDVINTWLTNVSIIKWYALRKEK